MSIHPIPDKLIKGSISVEDEVLAVYNNSNLVKQQTGLFNPQGKLILDPQFNKSRVALHSALRAKESQVNRKAQVNLNGQSRNQGYTFSEVEIHHQLWKMFIDKIGGVSEHEFPFLEEQSDHTPSFSASVFPSLPHYCEDEMWCTVRGGNLNATATLQKVRVIVKPAVPKAKSLPSSYVKPLQQAPVPSAGGNPPRSDLAISAKSKAELKAQLNLKDYSLLNLFPLSNTSIKAFHRPTPPLQEASPSELFDAVQDFLPISATLDSRSELPPGRQVPQGKRQTGQGSYQGEQSKGATSGSVQNQEISSGVGGQSGASGGDGGDRDPPWKDTRSHYDDDPKPKKKKKKKKAVEDEKEVLNSADSVTSDDEPKPKPKPQPQSDVPYYEWEADDEQPRRIDSGTHPESPLPTPHSAFAEEEHKTQPHFPEPCLPGYTAYCQDNQNVGASLVSPLHEETQNLPVPFSLNMSPPRLSPQSLSPSTSPCPPFEDMFVFPPSSPNDSAVSFQSEAGSTSYSSLSDTSTGIEETQNPASDGELPIFPPLSSLPAAEPSTTANSSPPPTTMEQPNLPKPFHSQVSPRATSESGSDDDSDASNGEKGDRVNG